MVTSDDIPVQADTDYFLTLRHKGSAGFAYVRFFNANNKEIPDPERQYFFLENSAKWKTGVCQGRVPAGAVKCKVSLRNFDGGKEGGTCFDTLEFRGGLEKVK